MKFIVTLTDNTNDKDLVFNVYQTDIARRWAEEVSKDYPLYETERFQGWSNSSKDLYYYISALTEQIEIVNNYKTGTIKFDKKFNQEALNYLHKFFEDLRGHVEEGTVFYNTAPNVVKQSIDKFNVLIHETEHLLRDSTTPTIIGTFNNRPRIPLIEEDYDHFTIKWKYGEVYINYCEVGKPLLDVFKDRDTYVGTDNIRPQEYYSADFMIKFGMELPNEYHSQRLQDFNSWYNLKNFNFKHKSLGMIPVAILEKGEPYAGFTKIKSVCIK
jgi:hypothetical protein